MFLTLKTVFSQKKNLQTSFKNFTKTRTQITEKIKLCLLIYPTKYFYINIVY